MGKIGNRCYENHIDLKLIDGLTISGGSCSYPLMDFDIYIGFDSGMYFDDQSYPWTKGEGFLFEIKDGQAPKNTDNFKKLIDWTITQLYAKKSIHVGCIGGHGRTGMFLSALYTTMTGEKDSITYVRENYCKSAVENQEQVNFLNKHYGITKQEGSRHTIDLRKMIGYQDHYSYRDNCINDFSNDYYKKPKKNGKKGKLNGKKVNGKKLKIIRIKPKPSNAVLVKD